MINLLPLEKQEIIYKEKRRRFLMAFGLGFAFVLFWGFILALPSFFYLTSKERELSRELKALEDSRILKDVKSIEEEIQNLSQKLTLEKQNRQKTQVPSVFLEKILSLKPQGLSINSLSYNQAPAQSAVSIRGSAQKRSILIDFADKLKKEPLIKNVNFPITNILKETNIEFTIIAEI